MKEIILQDKARKLFKDQYEEYLTIEKIDNNYYFSVQNKKYGPFMKIFLEKSRKMNGDIFIQGVNLAETTFYRMGINGLEEVEKVDTSNFVEEAIKEHVTNREFEACKKLGVVDNYGIYKDALNRVFAVDFSQPIKPLNKYKKFDSYAELFYTGYLVGLNLYDQDIAKKSDSKGINRFISQLRINLASKWKAEGLKERAEIVLPYLNWLKKLVGEDVYRNGELDVTIIQSQTSVVFDAKKATKAIREYENFDNVDIRRILSILNNNPKFFDEDKNIDDYISFFLRLVVNQKQFSKPYGVPAIDIYFNGQRKIFKFDTNLKEEISLKPEQVILTSLRDNSLQRIQRDTNLNKEIYAKLKEIYEYYKTLDEEEIKKILNSCSIRVKEDD